MAALPPPGTVWPAPAQAQVPPAHTRTHHHTPPHARPLPTQHRATHAPAVHQLTRCATNTHSTRCRRTGAPRCMRQSGVRSCRQAASSTARTQHALATLGVERGAGVGGVAAGRHHGCVPLGDAVGRVADGARCMHTVYVAPRSWQCCDASGWVGCTVVGAWRRVLTPSFAPCLVVPRVSLPFRCRTAVLQRASASGGAHAGTGGRHLLSG